MRYRVSDNELLYMIQQKDEQAMNILLDRYDRVLYPLTKDLLRKQGSLDVDDAQQMALMGFLSAVSMYREDRDVTFRYFAKMCAEREVRTMLRKERLRCNSANYKNYSLDQMVREEEGSYLVEFVENTHPEFEPPWYFEYQCLTEQFQTMVEALNVKERLVYDLWMSGNSYKEIAIKAGLTLKSVDNTLQRVRKKLNRMFD